MLSPVIHVHITKVAHQQFQLIFIKHFNQINRQQFCESLQKGLHLLWALFTNLCWMTKCQSSLRDKKTSRGIQLEGSPLHFCELYLQESWQEKEIKGIVYCLGRKIKKLFTLRWYDCRCRRSKKIDKKKTLLEILSDYSKVAGYRVNIQKSSLSIYEQRTRRIWVPHTLAPPKLSTLV